MDLNNIQGSLGLGTLGVREIQNRITENAAPNNSFDFLSHY